MPVNVMPQSMVAAPTPLELFRTARQRIGRTPWAKGGHGVTETLRWLNSIILRKHPTSFCSGAQYQLLHLWFLLMGVHNNAGAPSVAWMKRAMLAAFCRIDLDPIYNDGLPGYLVREEVARWVDVMDAKAGDCFQAWWQGPEVGAEDGHAGWVEDRDAIMHDGLGAVTAHPSGIASKGPVFWTWSSNYAQPAQYGRPKLASGHQLDYYRIHKGKRTFKVARPIWMETP